MLIEMFTTLEFAVLTYLVFDPLHIFLEYFDKLFYIIDGLTDIICNVHLSFVHIFDKFSQITSDNLQFWRLSIQVLILCP